MTSKIGHMPSSKLVFHFSFVVIFFFSSRYLALAQNVNLDQGLKLYLKFNSNLEDRSEDGLNSELEGTFFRKDRFGNCEYSLAFDDYLQLLKIDKEAFNNLSDFTVSVWIKTENSGFGTFLSVANALRDNELNLNVLQDGTIGSNIRNQPNVPGILIDGDINIRDGDWHHVVLTREGSSGEARIIVDNVLDVTKTMPFGDIQVAEGGAVLGNDQDCLAGCYSQNQQYLGLLDDLRVYDRVLNSNEITALFGLVEDESNQEPFGSFESVESCDQDLTIGLKRSFDSFTWNTGATTSTINVSSNGQYIVTGLIGDCIYSDTTQVQLNQVSVLEVLNQGLDLTCSSSIVLTADGAFDSFEWSNGEMSSSLTVTEPGVYYVEGTNDCGLVRSEEVVVTKSQVTEEVTISQERVSTSCGASFLLSASSGLQSYMWSTGESSSTIQVADDGEYSVSAINECGEQLTNTISVVGLGRRSYFIPNAFTPNGDLTNDYFEIDQRLLGSRLFIFNRWGQKIFEDLDYQNDWDGQEAQSGVYYYSVENECLIRQIKGWVTIIR